MLCGTIRVAFLRVTCTMYAVHPIPAPGAVVATIVDSV